MQSGSDASGGSGVDGATTREHVSSAPGASRSVRLVMSATTTCPASPCGLAIRPTSRSGRSLPSPPDSGTISCSVDDVDRRLLAVAGRCRTHEGAQRLSGASASADDPPHVALGDTKGKADTSPGLTNVDRHAFWVVHDGTRDVLEHRARCPTFDAVARVVRVVRTLAHGRGFHGHLVEIVELLAFLELVFVLAFKLVLYVLIAVALVCCIFGARRVKGTEVRFGEGVASGVGHRSD